MTIAAMCAICSMITFIIFSIILMIEEIHSFMTDRIYELMFKIFGLVIFIFLLSAFADICIWLIESI